MTSTPKIKAILVSNDYVSAKSRRQILIDSMSDLEKMGVDCKTCPGTCCTSLANSMLITPLETIELFDYLLPTLSDQESRNQLISSLKKTISNYRLDKEIYTGKKHTQTLRKLYTCPFFNNGSLGCSISRTAKPYGCLGFNPNKPEDNGQTCSSMTDKLLLRDQNYQANENQINQAIKLELNLDWEKKNIPMALLEVIERILPV